MPFIDLIQYTIPSSQHDFGLFKSFLMIEGLKFSYFFHVRVYYMQSSLTVSIKNKPPKKQTKDGLLSCLTARSYLSVLPSLI